jgi:hypothetical protein
MKLPGTYFAYALGMAVFGETTVGVHLSLLVASSLTIVLVFLLSRKLCGITAGLVAAAAYGVMSVSPIVLGVEGHATHFVVLFAVLATCLLLKAGETGRPGLVFVSGLFYGTAFLMKQQGLCFANEAGLARSRCPAKFYFLGGSEPAPCFHLFFNRAGRLFSKILVLDFRLCPFICHRHAGVGGG